MGRTVQNLEVNNFSGGLNTEASPLNYPVNSSLDEQNLVLNKDGSRQRRNGLERQAGESITSSSSSPLSSMFLDHSNIREGYPELQRFNHFLTGTSRGFQRIETKDGTVTWRADSTENSSGVPFYGAANSDGLISNSIGTLAGISVFPVSNEITEARLSSYQVGEFDALENYFRSPNILNVRVRDVWGSLGRAEASNLTRRYLPYEDGETRPSSCNGVYNLINGTWDSTAYWGEIKDETPTYYNSFYVAADKEPEGQVLPALSENRWAYTTTAKVSGTDYESDSYIVTTQFLNESNAYNFGTIFGKMTIEPFNRSYSRFINADEYWNSREEPFSGNNTLPAFSTLISSYPDRDEGIMHSVIAQLGRMWYIPKVSQKERLRSSPDLNSLVFFSQTVKDVDTVRRCYSPISPTGEDFEGLPDTSGGFVNIEGAQNIVKLVALQESVVAFASNGVWQIDGGAENFSANELRVQKLSSIGTEYPGSIVSTGGSVLYWSKGGIYQIVKDDISLKGIETNLSYLKVHSVVINNEYPERVKGAYDPVSGEVRWLFCEEGYTAVARQCSSELVYDPVSSNFTINRFPVGEAYPHLVGYVELDRSDRKDTDRGSSLRLLGVDKPTAGTLRFSLFDFTNESFLDYPDINSGTDAKAYMLGGYITASDSQRKKQIGYLTCNFKRTEDGFTGSEETGWDAQHPSGCLMQTQWGWTSSATPGMWGRKQQVYRLPRLYVPEDPATDDWSNFGYDVISSRNKIRGMGKALSILFESEEGKDMHFLGYGTVASIAQTV